MGSEISCKNCTSQIMELELSTMKAFQPKESCCASNKLETERSLGSAMKPSRLKLFSEDFYCPLVDEIQPPTQLHSQLEKARIDVEVEVKTAADNPSLELSEDRQDEKENVGESICIEPAALPDVEDGCMEAEDGNGEKDANLIIETTADAEMIDAVADKEAETTIIDLPLPILIEKTTMVVDIGINAPKPAFQDADVGTSQILMVESETGMSQPFTLDNEVQTSQSLLDELLASLARKSIGNGKQKTLNSSKNQVMHGSVATSTSPSPLFPRANCQAVDLDHDYAVPAKRPRLGVLDGNSAKRSIYSTAVTFDFDGSEKDLDDEGCEKSYDQLLSKDLEDKENEVHSPSPAFTTMPIWGSSRRQGLSKKARRKPLHPKILIRPQQNQEN